MRLPQTLFLLAALAPSVFAQQTVTDRLAAQNALFEEQYESDLRNFPERATAYGDYRYNDKLADYSLDALAQRRKTNQSFLTNSFHGRPRASTASCICSSSINCHQWDRSISAAAFPHK